MATLKVRDSSGNWRTFGGRQIAITTDDLPNSVLLVDRIIYIQDIEGTDDFPLGYVPQGCTVTKVVHKTDTGTVTYNIEKRAQLTPDLAGTNIWTVDEVASSTGEVITSFDSASISADQWLNFNASAVASSPTKLWIAVVAEIN